MPISQTFSNQLFNNKKSFKLHIRFCADTKANCYPFTKLIVLIPVGNYNFKTDIGKIAWKVT